MGAAVLFVVIAQLTIVRALKPQGHQRVLALLGVECRVVTHLRGGASDLLIGTFLRPSVDQGASLCRYVLALIHRRVLAGHVPLLREFRVRLQERRVDSAVIAWAHVRRVC